MANPYTTSSPYQRQWGVASAGDRPMVGDFDGDGLQDIAVWRAPVGVWYWRMSSDPSSYGAVQWGWEGAGDVPMIR